MEIDSFDSEHGINLAELFARVEYDRDLLLDMLAIFSQEFPKLHSLLNEALLRGDPQQVRASAHTLRGMLSSLSFGQASASALRIERMARQSNLSAIPAEIARLAHDTHRAQTNLQRACGQESW